MIKYLVEIDENMPDGLYIIIDKEGVKSLGGTAQTTGMFQIPVVHRVDTRTVLVVD